MAEEAAAVAAPPPADVEASQNGEQSTEDAAASTSAGPLSVEDAEKECKRQIEFYFGDSNLPYDKFLFTLQAKNDGWVPLATLTSFKRMRAIKDALSLERIAEIMQDSTEVTVSDDKASVKRARPLVRPTDSFERSAYVKGFPEETETLQQELEQFFAQFGKINSVRMRRDAASKPKRNAFKGSVFVEFAEVADMEALLAKGSKESEPIKYGDAELKVMSKDAYCTMKMIEKGLDPSTMQRGSGGNKPSTSSAMNKKFNAFKEIDRHSRGLPSVLGEGNQEQERRNKKEDEEERRRKAKEDRVKPLEFDFMESKLTTLPDGTVEAETVQFPAQSVLAFTGAGQGGSWRDLKDTLVTMHPTSFVEFPNGAVEGAVGFKSTVNDDILKEIQAKGITVGGQVVEWSRVDEERAKKFYLDRANFRAAFLVDQRELREAEGAAFGDRRQFGHGARGGGGRGRGGRGGGRGGRGGRGGGRGGGGNRQGGQGYDQKRKRDGDNGSAADSNAPPVIASAKKAKTDA